jgi:hypothetical protein
MSKDSKALEFIYQDTQIHFLLGNEKNVMVNATEMAKPFGKEVRSFLRLEGTEKYIELLIKKANIRTDVYGYNENIVAEVPQYNREDFVYSKNKAGTFLHRKLALKFAAWLDVEFEDWIYDTIEKILFGNAKKVGEKISDAELKKIQIAELIQKVRDSGDATAISLLDNLEELKVIEKEKKKAMIQFSNQFKIEFN